MQEHRGAAPLPLRAFAVAFALAVAFAMAGGAVATARPAAEGAPAPAQPKSFARDVAPMLDHWCVACHQGDEPHGGLRLDSFAGVLRGGDTGPAVIPGDPDASLLVAKIERRDRPSMPPRRRFPAPLTATIRAWIAAGAPP